MRQIYVARWDLSRFQTTGHWSDYWDRHWAVVFSLLSRLGLRQVRRHALTTPGRAYGLLLSGTMME